MAVAVTDRPNGATHVRVAHAPYRRIVIHRGLGILHKYHQSRPVILITVEDIALCDMQGNRTESIPDSYRRYLINAFRKHLKLKGTPLRFGFRTGDNPFKGRKNKLSKLQTAKCKHEFNNVKKNSVNKSGGRLTTFHRHYISQSDITWLQKIY